MTFISVIEFKVFFTFFSLRQAYCSESLIDQFKLLKFTGFGILFEHKYINQQWMAVL